MENEHPIESLMRTTLDSIKNMVDVNTILGDPVETPDGKVIVPVSRVTFGFAAGGTEYEPAPEADGGGKGSQGGTGGLAQGSQRAQTGDGEEERLLPFGGGSGAGISIQPMGFLVVGREEMRLLPVDGQVLYDRLIDLAPRLLEGLQGLVRGWNGNAGPGQQAVQGSTAPAPQSAPQPVQAPPPAPGGVTGAPPPVAEAERSRPLFRLRSRERGRPS